MNDSANKKSGEQPCKETADYLNYEELRKAVYVLRAVNHDLRQQIIQLLLQHDQLSVTELYVKLRQEQSIISQHLAVLRRVGLVTTKRRGKYVYYSVQQERLAQIQRLINELAASKD